MATNGNRGRGRGGGPNGGGNRGGDSGNRRGSWRAGPPGSAGFNNNGPRTGTPNNGNGPGGSTPPAGPRQSINDHMNDMKRAQQDKPGKTFQTDTEISATNNANKPRELQRWQGDTAHADSTPSPGSATGSGNGEGAAKANGKNAQDAETFGAAAGKWDQFETNSRLFGTQTSYQEELYTTKLNKSGADFKAREKEADKLAAEILNQNSGNFHILEERGAEVSWADDVDEEEKYSGVARNPNAYVPPAARRGGYAAAAGRPSAPPPAQATKPNGQVPLNGDKAPLVPLNKGPAIGAQGKPQPPAASKGGKPVQARVPASAEASKEPASPAPASSAAPAIPGGNGAAPTKAAEAAEKKPDAAVTPTVPLDVPVASGDAAAATSPIPTTATEGTDPSQINTVVGAYRQFVDKEREKVVAKKQSIAKSEREKQLADLKKFQASFKVPLPMPKDILPILAKDEEKQKAIEAQAETSLKAAREAATKKSEALKSPDPTGGSGKKSAKKIQMSIAEIPPFNPNKAKPSPASQLLPIPESARHDIPMDDHSPAAKNAALPANGAKVAIASVSPAASVSSPPSKPSESSLSAKLNPKASAFVFKPNANAPAFKPGQPSSPASVVGRITSPAAPLNPFFGDEVPRSNNDIRSEFNPFRSARGPLPMANTIAPTWPYNGRPVQISYVQPGPPGSFVMPEDENSQYARAGPMGLPLQGHPGMRYSQSGIPNMNMQGNPLYPPGHGGPIPPGNGFAQMPGNMPMGGYPQQFLGGPQGMYFNPGPNGNGGNMGPNGVHPNGLPGPNGPNGHNGHNGPGQFMSPQMGQNAPPGHFAGPGSPTHRGSMHHQQMQSLGGPGGPGGPMYPFQQNQGPVGPGPGPGQGPGSASASSQAHPHPGGQGSQMGTPMQTPQIQHANPYPAQTPFQQHSPAPPSIPQMAHP